MKTTKVFLKSLILAIIFSFSVVAMKADISDPEFGIANISIVADKESNALMLRISNPDNQPFNVRLYNETKQNLYQEKVKNQTSYSKKLKLKLEDGRYFLAIEDENGIRIQPFTVASNSIEVDYQNLDKMSKPVFKQVNDMLQIRMSANQPSTLQITFLDESDRTFFDEEVLFAQQFNRLYNLKNLTAGKYTVRIDTGNFVSYKKIEVK